MENKDKYCLDEKNRLIISRQGKKIAPSGTYATDKNNRLIYRLNEPLRWRKEYSLPNSIRFEGSYSLDDNHDLQLTLGKGSSQTKDILTLKGEIVSVQPQRLAFAVKSYDLNGFCHISLLQLSGSWFSDEANRISFSALKNGPPDILTFKGDWQINRSQQITYSYEKPCLGSKKKPSKSLVFEGYWDINSRNRISYSLEKGSGSSFDFRGQIGSPNLYPQQGKIKYRLGAGKKSLGGAKEKIIYLFGEWKISRSLGLSFQTDYGRGNIRNIDFGAEVKLNKGDSAVFALKDKQGKGLGASLVFERKFLKKLDAKSFLKVMGDLKKLSAVECGVRVPF